MGAECFKCHGDLTYDGNCPTCEARTDRDRLRAERDEARREARELADALRLLAPWQSRHYRDRFDALPWAKEES